eukprot:3740857-Rhodomonas_salina.1
MRGMRVSPMGVGQRQSESHEQPVPKDCARLLRVRGMSQRGALPRPALSLGGGALSGHPPSNQTNRSVQYVAPGLGFIDGKTASCASPLHDCGFGHFQTECA